MTDWLDVEGADEEDALPPPPVQRPQQRFPMGPALLAGALALVLLALFAFRVFMPEETDPPQQPAVVESTATAPASIPAASTLPSASSPPSPAAISDADAVAVVGSYEAAVRTKGTADARRDRLEEVASLRLASELAAVDPEQMMPPASEPRVIRRQADAVTVATALADGGSATYVVGRDRGAVRVIASGRQRSGAPTPTAPHR